MTASGAWARRRARRAALQAVYQWQMTAADAYAVEQEFVESGALKRADEDFFRALLRGVMFSSDDLDQVLMPLLDRRVEEHEYVGLAKVFGAEDSFKYINGVLDRLAIQLRPLERPSP